MLIHQPYTYKNEFGRGCPTDWGGARHGGPLVCVGLDMVAQLGVGPWNSVQISNLCLEGILMRRN